MLKTISAQLKGTTTPLASIFGSGFLVIVSVLYGVVGQQAFWAMTGICLVAYLVGSVIRFNIRHVEPIVQNNTQPHVTRLDRLSDVLLVPAYVISVTLYLRILAAYALGYWEIDTTMNEQLLTSGVIVLIWVVSVTKGLVFLEGMERWALRVTMLIIVVIIVVFVWRDLGNPIPAPVELSTDPWLIMTTLAGALIVVQGFETTRYLGDEYDQETRIKACRNSQIIATVVYLLLVLAATPLLPLLFGANVDNGLMTLVSSVALFLSVPLVIAAVFSQFSAAVADAIGASGNVLELTNKKISAKLSYTLICGLAVILTWSADTMQILALASKAFALYYLIQAVIALLVTNRIGLKVLFGLVALAMGFVVIFAAAVG